MGREEGSGWGTHVYLWRIHFDIWQNQYNIVKFKNKIKFKKISRVTIKKKKEVQQGCLLPPCLFNPYAEHIMRNAGLEETQAGIKIARRNINNLRYVDDTTHMAESKEQKSLLMKVRGE